MRVGIVSDVHEDLRRALTLLEQKGCDEIVLAFEECEVPATSLLGAGGDGFEIAMQVLDKGRLTMAACCLGAMGRLIEFAEYANTRVKGTAVEPFHRDTRLTQGVSEILRLLVVWEMAR